MEALELCGGNLSHNAGTLLAGDVTGSLASS